ncbi:hypothetical protein [Aeromonas sp.]|uniref:hypothetical protein n=1 Tax=Aeromonas sp. TaxID=647 RepID=UPI00258B44CF|nr:hypothetical protein [Aeromonas sp.]MCX7131063.1 hypothetical protein [Aeromonas sp.]
MNVEILEYLLKNENHIEDMAKNAKVDSGASFGIIKLLLANHGDIGVLKGKQIYHYENVIKPLLENVQCEGPMGMMDDDNGNWVSSCVNDGIVDDESLYQSYLEEDFKCQICRHDAEKMR